MAVVEQSGKFFVRLYIGKGIPRKWIKQPFETRAEAEAHEARLKAGARSETLDEFCDRWLREEPPAKQSTLRTYTGALKRFSEDFKGVPVGGQLDTAPWARTNLISGTNKQVAKAWARQNNHRRDVVTTLYNAAINEGLCDENPFANLRLKRSRGRKEIVPLTEAEVEALALEARSLRPELAATMEGAVLTLAYTGMRVSELFALRYSDVDLKAGEVRISRRAYDGDIDTPKNSKPRTILLPERACEGIAGVPRTLGEDLIFTSAQGHMFRSESFHRGFVQMRQRFEAKLSAPRLEELKRYRPPSHQGLTPHEMRHFAASWMLNLGATPEMVGTQLGHTDGGVLVSSLYGHPDQDRMREKLRSLVAPRPVTELARVRHG